MTRVNLIPVEELSDSHLLAEHRELKRIPNCIIKWESKALSQREQRRTQGKFSLKNIPEHYTMGKGHVKFFYPRLRFITQRYVALYDECIKRGFKVENYISAFKDCYQKNKDLYLGEFFFWKPTEQDIRVSRTRIAEKIFQKDVCQQKKYYRWSKPKDI